MPKIQEILSGAAAIAKGMGVTITEMMNPVITDDYPDAPPRFEERYRGLHVLQRDENGLEKCVACFLCSAACPTQCIYIEAADNTARERISGGERYAKVYNIDYSRCIFCGYCVEACPKDAIGMTTTYNQVASKRSDFIFDKARLLRNNDEYMAKNGLTTSGKAPDGSYPFSPDGCGPDITHGMGSYRVSQRLYEMSQETPARQGKAAAK
ncbi:MAG: NADH-quinone oxidoreductase subunit NuoI [Planctomycetaceae bacterium]|nr:NADH-quinone oxidoreductase subunit NuoI [Planctomycetaceae bacterium]